MLHLYYQRRCWTATTHWPPRLHSWHCHCYAGTLHNKGDVNLPDSSVDLNSYHIRKQHPRASGIAPESPSCDDGALLLSYGVSLVYFKVFVWLHTFKSEGNKCLLTTQFHMAMEVTKFHSHVRKTWQEPWLSDPNQKALIYITDLFIGIFKPRI